MTMNQVAFNRELMMFIQQSPTPFHAVEVMSRQLEQAGFQRLLEADEWQLQPGGKYFVTRNGSSIVAFRYGRADLLESGFRIVGAHTDSPCLKVKPNPELYNKQYFQLAVEVYGGVLLNPWFDRDLSLAGRVTYQDGEGQLKHALIDFQKPVAVIPSLAIHLDRDVNSNRSINPQTQIPPVLMRAEDGAVDFRDLLLERLVASVPGASRVLDFELSFYDTQAPALVGLHDDFIAAARLDNLLSCFTGMQSLIDTDTEQTCVLVCNDHEEVGSQSAAGAQGPMLKSVLQRMANHRSDMVRILDRSMTISSDNAHGVHPNYVDRHDSNHGPILNAGPVIKLNANQRYASNSETMALFRYFAEAVEVPVQSFVVRADMACGSTIGPITAGELGVKTLDVGVPTFAMHSIRELAGSDDAYSLYKVLQQFNCAASVDVA